MSESQITDSGRAFAVRKIRDRIAALITEIEQRFLRRSELRQAIGKAETELTFVLEVESRAFRVFDRMRQENMTRTWRNAPEYVLTDETTYVAEFLAVAEAVLAQLEPEFAPVVASHERQVILPAGDPYRAMKLFYNLLKRAKKEILVSDPYLDDDVFPFIESLGSQIGIKLLTSDKKPIFPKLLRAFQGQRSGVEGRLASTIHGRFLILDNAHVRSFGTSINGLGAKLDMVNEVVDPTARAKAIAEIGAAWSAAVPIL